MLHTLHRTPHTTTQSNHTIGIELLQYIENILWEVSSFPFLRDHGMYFYHFFIFWVSTLPQISQTALIILTKGMLKN